MSPLELEILFWYFCRVEDHKDAASPPPSQKEAFARFVENGYLDDNAPIELSGGDMKYTPTEKLYVYCEALCKVPEPKQKWIV